MPPAIRLMGVELEGAFGFHRRGEFDPEMPPFQAASHHDNLGRVNDERHHKSRGNRAERWDFVLKTWPGGYIEDQVARLLYQDGAMEQRGTMKSDGSVHIRHQNGGSFVSPNGEMVSPPLPRDQIPEWVRSYYPDAVNETCGMHVHMSFERNCANYTRLISNRDAMQNLVKRLVAFADEVKLPMDHSLRYRLGGTNRFCMPNRQLQPDQNFDRYSAINTSAWEKHETVEIRVLPMFVSIENAIDAINVVADWAEETIAAVADEEEAEITASQAPPSEADLAGRTFKRRSLIC